MMTLFFIAACVGLSGSTRVFIHMLRFVGLMLTVAHKSKARHVSPLPLFGSGYSDDNLPFSYAEIRNQLVEQFRCLEQQSESRLQLLQDLQDFFRRKAELQLEYSRGLDKLAERYSAKIRSSREHQHFK